MKIKIGNFNFINKKGNKFSLLDYNISSDLFNYFYLDGKEDTLYVNSDYYFELRLDFEKQLLEKYKVVDYNKEITNQVNSFIQEKAKEIFKSQNYSRYDLYNEINLYDILNVEKDSEFVFDSSHSSINFDNNKITKNDISFNLYLGKIENLEEMYKEGKFDKQINASLINLELENNIAPKFMTELIKINDFLKDKKSVNILLKGCEKSKRDPHISYILDLSENSITLNLGWNAEKYFKKANPNKNIKDLKLEDLQGLSYGEQVLEINSENLIDLRKQIAITPEDKLLFKIDELKEELEDKFMDYKNNLHIKDNVTIRKMPYTLESCLNEINKLDSSKEEYPDWYSEDLEKLFKENNLLNSLNEAGSIWEIQCIAEHLEDEELISIINEFKTLENLEDLLSNDEEEM